MNIDEARALLAKPKGRKFRNKPTKLDGHSFASQAEAQRYAELVILRTAGKIRDLKLHPRIPLRCRCGCDFGIIYVADFAYEEWRDLPLPGGLVAFAWQSVVEDIKGGRATQTAVFKLKAKLMKACLGIEVRLVGKGL